MIACLTDPPDSFPTNRRGTKLSVENGMNMDDFFNFEKRPALYIQSIHFWDSISVFTGVPQRQFVSFAIMGGTVIVIVALPLIHFLTSFCPK